MTSLSLKLMASAIACAVVVAGALADAKARKHKKHVAHAAQTVGQTRDRGTNLFPAGPVYFANDYLGDDPDPFIRLQLLRDLGAHFGGED